MSVFDVLDMFDILEAFSVPFYVYRPSLVCRLAATCHLSCIYESRFLHSPSVARPRVTPVDEEAEDAENDVSDV